MNTIRDEEKSLHIVMFPWLAFGHMIPYLELAKLIAQKGHQVSYVSTPRNIQRLPELPSNVAPLIKFVSLPLPKVDNLPEDAEATRDISYKDFQYIEDAFDKLEQPLTDFLESSDADWILHDFAPFWLGPVATKFGIKCAFFCTFSPQNLAFLGPISILAGKEKDPRTKLEDYTSPPPWIPFKTTVAYQYFEIKKNAELHSGISGHNRFASCIQNCDTILIRGCTKFESEWFQLLQNILEKPVLPTGKLPTTEFEFVDENDTWKEIKKWLDNQPRGSVVYVAFGSESTLSQEEVNEIALGLEKSNLPFFWVLKAQHGSKLLQLPEGFEDRTKGRGVVCTYWAPQMKILGHAAIGAFFSHAGWASVMEAVQNEKPLVIMTFFSDQGLNAKILEEKKIAYTMPRDEQDGSFTSDSVVRAIRLVMLEEEGSIYRESIKEAKDYFVNIERQDRYIDNLLNHLKNRLER